MHFKPGHTYHIYNRGNQRQPIFFTHGNYLYFLTKIRREWLPFANILAYCLMPNYFNFLIIPNETACKAVWLGNKETHMQELSKAIGKTLSSYTKAINKINRTSGNLFQKKTQSRCIDELEGIVDGYTLKDYLLTSFHYIHNNPLRSGIVKNLSEWAYSSWPDYYGYRKGTLCNQELIKNKLRFYDSDFNNIDGYLLDQKLVANIW